MTTLRKVAGVTQMEMAKTLGIEQASVSRIEAGSQWLSPAQLVKLCSYFGISAEAIFSGKYNADEIARRFGQEIRLPQRYSKLAYSKVRELMPLIAFARQKKGDAFIDSFLEETHISQILMMSPSHSVGVNCYLDLMSHMISADILNPRTASDMAHLANQREMHVFLDEIYSAHEGPLDLMQSRIENAHHYDGNFKYKLVEVQSEFIEVSVRPEKHLEGLPYRDETMKDLICRIRKEVLRGFPVYSGMKPLKLEETHCHFRDGADDCKYRLYDHQHVG